MQVEPKLEASDPIVLPFRRPHIECLAKRAGAKHKPALRRESRSASLALLPQAGSLERWLDLHA